MSAKRTPQTAAKRAREQRVREKRELKAEKKKAANLARMQPDPDGTTEAGDGSAELSEPEPGDGVGA